MLGQQPSAFVEAGFDRALPSPDGRGDLPLAQVGVVAKDDDDPQVQRQVLQGAGHVL